MLLLPPSFALTSCLAAALRFLATYWSSVLCQQPYFSPTPSASHTDASNSAAAATAVGAGKTTAEAAQGGTEQQQQQQQQQQAAHAQAASAEIRGCLARSGLLQVLSLS